MFSSMPQMFIWWFCGDGGLDADLTLTLRHTALSCLHWLCSFEALCNSVRGNLAGNQLGCCESGSVLDISTELVYLKKKGNWSPLPCSACKGSATWSVKENANVAR